jgi:hypothetical protein
VRTRATGVEQIASGLGSQASLAVVLTIAKAAANALAVKYRSAD